MVPRNSYKGRIFDLSSALQDHETLTRKLIQLLRKHYRGDQIVQRNNFVFSSLCVKTLCQETIKKVTPN